MVKFNAGVWLLLVFVYFSIFVLLVSSLNGLSTESYNSTADKTNFDMLNANHICSNPRFKHDVDGKVTEYSLSKRDHLDCDESSGIYSESDCLSLEGCSWDVTTSAWWQFWETGGQSVCTGYINASYYGVENTSNGKRIELHNNSGFWAGAYLSTTDPSPCNHPNVLFDRDKCNIFSCSWIPYDISEDIKSPSSIVSTMNEVFTFRYNFGLEIDNDGIVWFLRIIFILLPLLIMIISIYMLIPFI